MESLDPIEQAVKAIVNLGIASAEQLEPHVAAWRERPPTEDTSDDEIELAGFLTALHQSGVLNRSQGRTLLTMLSGRLVAPPDDPYLGRRFGHYIADAKLGEGGMGKVYRATKEGSLHGHYVLKVFHAGQDPAGAARFQRECEVMASLDHPNIVRVYDSGQEGGLYYLVLEYVEGPTLQELLDERGRFSWQSATRALKQIASAVAAAHERGIIHRDLKPSNILVSRGGVIKVFDFGLAKSIDSKKVSQAGEILGSPAYMAPEQWGDHEVDARADLFALGVVYYQLLTGAPPFRGNTAADLSWRIQTGHYDPIETVAPDVPQGVRALVSQLLERDRAFRPPSATVLISELDRVARGDSPNLPRIQALESGVEPGVSYLVGQPPYALGSGPGVVVRLEGVGAVEATIERTLGGTLLRAREGGAGCHVNGASVEEIVLRDKDTIQIGDGPVLRFRAGNLAGRTTTRFASDRLALNKLAPAVGPDATRAPEVVPGLLHAALVEAAHPRVLVSCFEALDAGAMVDQVDLSGRRLGRSGLPKPEVDRVVERSRVLSQERAWRIADALFRTTHENLGRAVEAWLAWWFEARGTYPVQLRGPGPRARGRLTVTRPDEDASIRTIPLTDQELWTLGRSEDVDIPVSERSVSRRHLEIIRLNGRYAFRDLGSRFGTTVGDKRRDVGLLADGDILALGRTRVLFEDTLREEETLTGECVEVDPGTFAALVDLRSQTVLATLIRLLDPDALRGALLQAGARYEPAETLATVLDRFLVAWRERAREVLPHIAGSDLGPEAEAWRAWLRAREEQLPPQVEPYGWGT